MKHDPTQVASTCEIIQEILSARLDGEALAEESDVVSKHLHSCALCVAYENELRDLDVRVKALYEQPEFHCDSERLWKNIQVGLDRIDSNRSSNGLARWFAGVAIAACLIICISVVTVLSFSSRTYLLPVVAETVRDYETFRVRGELLDVDVKSTAEIMQWMSAKVEFAIPETISPPAGYTISGGRLCSFLNRRLAFFQYERGSSDLALYVMEADGLEIPQRGLYKTSTTDEGLTAVTWARDDLVYVIVSDLPPGELAEFAART